jgi:hypothetical protein
MELQALPGIRLFRRDCSKSSRPKVPGLESPDRQVTGLEKQAPGSGYQTENFGDVGQINKTRYIDSQAIRIWP